MQDTEIIGIRKKSRIRREDAKNLFLNATDEELMSLATEAKALYHPADAASYLIMAIVNYTNVCVAKCDYCAFYRLPHEQGAYLLSPDQVAERIENLLELGGQLVGYNGGFHPKLKLRDYGELFQAMRSRFGSKVAFYEMTVAEFMFSCKASKLSYQEGADLLKSYGTAWVTGGGAEILDNNFRERHSPGKYTVEDYFTAQKAILESGLGSTATMVIGFDETLEERFNHLEALRDFQDNLPPQQKMPSFLCWTYKPQATRLGGKEISAKEYLRWLAICRLYLDNFGHIRTSVLTQNENALLGLKYGANDFDLPTEDEVTQKAGATISHEFSRILACAEELGIKTTKREPFVFGSLPYNKNEPTA